MSKMTIPDPKFRTNDVVETQLRPGRYIVIGTKWFFDPPHWGYWLANSDGEPLGWFDEIFLKPIS